MLGFDQSLADAAEQAHLGIDRLAGCLELLLMLVLGGVEQLAEDAVVQVDDLVSDGSHALDSERYQSGVAALRLELGQIGGRHLAALAGDLEQSVLVYQPLDSRRQVERLPGFEALDVFDHVPGVRLGGRLAQPGQPGRLAVVAALEKIVEATAMRVQQRFGQCFVDTPVGAGDCLGADALDDTRRRKEYALTTQAVHQSRGQHDAFVGLPCQFIEAVYAGSIVPRGERLVAKG